MDIETVIKQLEYWDKYGQETGNFQYNVYTNARDMLIKIKSERDEALKKLTEMESQEPVAWVTSRPDICYFTTGRESAERWRKGGWTVDPLYAKPVQSHSQQSAVSIQDELLFVGYTNGSQIGYAKESEGAFYKDTDNGCIIPLYMLCAHEHRLIGTTLKNSEEIPLPEGCKLCFECDGSCYDRCPSHESEGE